MLPLQTFQLRWNLTREAGHIFYLDAIFGPCEIGIYVREAKNGRQKNKKINIIEIRHVLGLSFLPGEVFCERKPVPYTGISYVC